MVEVIYIYIDYNRYSICALYSLNLIVVIVITCNCKLYLNLKGKKSSIWLVLNKIELIQPWFDPIDQIRVSGVTKQIWIRT